MVNISIVIPAYNEQDSIAKTIQEIKEVLSKSKNKYEIITVNDGSKDNTSEILKSIKNIIIINHPYNKGYGASIKTGIKNSKYDWILITDSDNTYPIKDIPKLISYIENYDMIIGARKKDNIPILRKPAKAFLSLLANFLTNRKIPDLNSGFRIFKKDLALRFFNIFPSGFSFTTTITLAALTNEYNVKFVPIDYYKRQGRSKIKPKEFINFFVLILRIITYFEPIKIFSLISLILFFIATIIFIYTAYFIHRIADITVIVILLASIQIFLFGLIADMIARKRS
nr:glycosyltransferase family 2 protein [Candidatus Woesearchaeota archaeon]